MSGASIRSRRREYRRVLAYLITSPTGKGYVGITVCTLNHRWWVHRKDARDGKNNLLSRAIRKHGSEAFTIEHIATATCWDDACALERALILQHGTRGARGYNLTAGGDGTVGRAISQTNKLALAAALRTPAHRAYTSARFKGVPKTTEHRVHLVAALYRRFSSPEERARHSAAQLKRFRGSPKQQLGMELPT